MATTLKKNRSTTERECCSRERATMCNPSLQFYECTATKSALLQYAVTQTS